MGNLLYEDESYKIRGACFRVYNAFGGNIREKTIEKVLTKELRDCGIDVKNQVRIDVIYKNEKVGIYMPDIVVNDKIIIEIKSKPYLTKQDEKQFWSYLKCSSFQLGFLVNFGSEKISMKRFIYTKKLSV
jgi:GxxExxY protein